DVVVVITRQTPEQDESLLFPGTSPFDGPLLGGLVSQAPELQALGIPTGQGDVEAGFHAGGGVELRLAKGLSLNLDYRLTGVGGAVDLLARHMVDASRHLTVIDLWLEAEEQRG